MHSLYLCVYFSTLFLFWTDIRKPCYGSMLGLSLVLSGPSAGIIRTFCWYDQVLLLVLSGPSADVQNSTKMQCLAGQTEHVLVLQNQLDNTHVLLQ